MLALQVTLERIKMGPPELAERLKPVVQFPQALGLEAVDPPLRVHRGLDHPGLPENAEVLGDRGLGHVEAAFDFPYGLVGGDQEAEDGPAIGLGHEIERGVHGSNIRLSVYTCQGIYESDNEPTSPMG